MKNDTGIALIKLFAWMLPLLLMLWYSWLDNRGNAVEIQEKSSLQSELDALTSRIDGEQYEKEMYRQFEERKHRLDILNVQLEENSRKLVQLETQIQVLIEIEREKLKEKLDF
jgi:hypothetical protein